MRVVAAETVSQVCVRRTLECTAPSSARHPGSTAVSFELPEAIVAAIGRGKIDSALRKHAHGIEVRRTAVARREAIRKALREFKRPSTIARALNITEARVRQVRAELAAEEL